MQWLTESLRNIFDTLQAPAQMYLQYSLQKNQAKYAAKIAQAQAEAQRAMQAIEEARLRLERERALREAQAQKQLTKDLVQQYTPLIITSLILLVGGAVLIAILTRKK